LVGAVLVYLSARPLKKMRLYTFTAVVPLGLVVTPMANHLGFLFAGFDPATFAWVYYFHGNLRLTLLLFLFNIFLYSFRKISTPPFFDAKLALERNKKVTMVPVEDIFFIRSADDYVAFHTKKGEFLKRSTLKTLNNFLDPEKFIRIHKTAIVNIGAIKALVPEPNGDFFLELENGERLRGSRRFKTGLKQKINGL